MVDVVVAQDHFVDVREIDPESAAIAKNRIRELSGIEEDSMPVGLDQSARIPTLRSPRCSASMVESTRTRTEEAKTARKGAKNQSWWQAQPAEASCTVPA